MKRDVSTVVVSGLPASGKTTVARQIAPLLALPLVDKDDLLEASFRLVAEVSPTDRARLSRKADEDLRQRLESEPRAVVVSHWRRPELSATSGTPTDWLRVLPELVEVHCLCGPETAAERFCNRDRHPAHGDRQKSPVAILNQFRALHQLGPLGVGPVVTVNTEMPVDAARLALQIQQAI
ncbi:MAG: AAA family ATPase [bacterium]|nr:AAA family ATPase [bacterium]